MVRDRDKRHVGKGSVEGMKVRQVEPAVHGGNAFRQKVLEHRKVQEIDMEVYEVEFFRLLPHSFEHHQGAGRVVIPACQSQGSRHNRNQLGIAARVTTGEKRYVLRLSDK